jgi:hypothetical protein
MRGRRFAPLQILLLGLASFAGPALSVVPPLSSLSSFNLPTVLKEGEAFTPSQYADKEPWGHVYVENWVDSIEFFRATFGAGVPCGSSQLVLADPFDSCVALEPSAVKGRVVVAQRGSCSFQVCECARSVPGG